MEYAVFFILVLIAIIIKYVSNTKVADFGVYFILFFLGLNIVSTGLVMTNYNLLFSETTVTMTLVHPFSGVDSVNERVTYMLLAVFVLVFFAELAMVAMDISSDVKDKKSISRN